MTVARITPGPALITCAERQEALNHLCSVREDLGYVPDRTMGEIADLLQVSKSHLRKMLVEFRRTHTVRRKTESSPKKIVLEDEWRAQVAYFVANGNATKAWEALRAAGVIPLKMSVKAFQRRVSEWDPALRACAKGGFRAMVAHQFFNVEHIPHKGYAYGTDHTALGIQVLPERGTKPIWPWLSFIMDLHTRLVIAWQLTAHVPNSTDDIDLLLEAIDGWYTEDGVFVGGKPGFLRTDRGGDYISEALSRNLIALDIGRQFTAPYSSHQNGRVERLNGTIDTNFSPTVPGFFPGGEDAYNRRALKTPINPASLVGMEGLDRRMGDFFAEYNNTPHSALNGATPLEAWLEDPRVVEKADKDTIVAAMTPRETRTLNKYGIEVRNAIYSHPTLAALRKANVNEVEVRYHEHDKARIEVIVDGEWACTATKSYLQPEHHKLGVLSARAAQRREAEKLVRQADYERVLLVRQAMAEEGSDESAMPLLPPDPSQEAEVLSQAELDFEAAVAAAVAATKKAQGEHGGGFGDGSDGLHRETAGHILTGGGLSAEATRYLTQSIAGNGQQGDPANTAGGASFGALTVSTAQPDPQTDPQTENEGAA